MRREDKRETLQSDWAWKIKRHSESRAEIEDKVGDKMQGQQPQRSDMPLENPFYSWSILPVLSLQGKLTSLHGSPESPGVHLKASKSKLIGARTSLLSGWNITIPLLRQVTPTQSTIYTCLLKVFQYRSQSQHQQSIRWLRTETGQRNPLPLCGPCLNLSSNWIFYCGIMKEDRKTYDKALC